MNRAAEIKDLSELAGFREILITGGEPLLNPRRTLGIIEKIKCLSPDSKIYVYTAWFDEKLADIIEEVDGIHYTLHAHSSKRDIADFQRFQDILPLKSKKSFRLYINPSIKHSILIKTGLWHRIEIKPWLTEEELLRKQPDGLPMGEKLYVLENC